MSIAVGNKGTFTTHRVTGYSPEIKDGKLSITMIIADGNGSSQVLVHEQEIEVDETRQLLFEGHAREILALMAGDSEILMSFATLGHKLEHISALFTNSNTDSTVRAILGAPEGVIAIINVKGGAKQIPIHQNGSTIRYEAALRWMGIQAGPWRASGTISINNGVKTEELGVIGKN